MTDNNCPFCHLRHDPEKTHCNDPHTGALIRRAGPITPMPLTHPIKLDLTPYGALDLLVRRVNEIKGQWTESLDTAMQRAKEVIQREQDRLSKLARAMMQSIHPDNPPLTCQQHLEHARDAADSMLDELTEANKTCGGLASLLLLDMVRETSVMASRIRAIIQAASSDAGPPSVKLLSEKFRLPAPPSLSDPVGICPCCQKSNSAHIGGRCPFGLQ